jgi:prolyl 4-hydroxylase
MDSVDEAYAAVQRGEIARGLQLLQRASEAGDGDASFELGLWLFHGQLVRRDLRRARICFKQAAEGGNRMGASIYLSLLANGIGGERDWPEALRLLGQLSQVGEKPAADQLALLSEMSLDNDGDPRAIPGGERLLDTPEVTLFRGFASPDECSYLVRVAEPAFQPATVGHVSGRTQQHNQQIRTCDVAAFPWIAEDLVIQAFNRRIAAASATTAQCGEPLQILRYLPGQQFRPHRDCVEPGGNQRMFTMLVYLNEDYTGGETEFLKTGFKVKGSTGDAILFRNVDSAGNPDPDSLHAGLPVTSGVKLLASRWIRQHPFGSRL